MTKAWPKYVKRDFDRAGNERFYLRLPGQPKVRLPEKPGHPDFDAAYQAGLNAPAKPKRPIAEARTLPGSINQLIVSYYGSTAWDSLAAATKGSRRSFLERFREKHGDKPAAKFDAAHCHAMLAKVDSPINQRNYRVALRGLFKHAKATGLAASDPTDGYELPRAVIKRHRRWEPEHIAQFEAHWPIGSMPRLALALLRYTGLRRSDLVRLGPQHIRRDEIVIKTQKTGGALVLPLMPQLKAIIAATKTGHLAFLMTSYGKPMTVFGFGHRMKRWCTEAGLPDDLTTHGMRHAVGCTLAENGASVDQIMAVLGHRDPAMSLHYTRQANQARLARDGLSKIG